MLLGPNNHGKSNVLTALKFFLEASAKASSADLCQHRTEDDNVAWVDVTFEDLSTQEERTFKKYVASDGSVRIRKTATFEDGKSSSTYNGWLSEPKLPWLKADSASVNRADLEAPLVQFLPGNLNFSSAAVRAAQDAYIQANAATVEHEFTLESTPLLGPKNVAAGVLPAVFLIPAVWELAGRGKRRSY